MKSLSLLFIMAALSFKLNAFDVNSPTPAQLGADSMNSPDIKKMEEIIRQAKEVEKTGRNDGRFSLEREDLLNDEGPCMHCPRYFALTSQVNKIVTRLAKDPKNYSEELPIKVNRLRFLYYTQKNRLADGTLGCRRYMDNTPDLKPTKFDGQFKLMVDEVFKFSAVTDVQYMNPETEETVYYYRGEGDEKNIFVQAVLTKEGARLRTYRYYPSERESNPYNLPDLSKTYADKEEARNDVPILPIVITSSNESFSGRGVSYNEYITGEKEKALTNEDAKDKVEAPGSDSTLGLRPGKYDMKLKVEVEKRHKYIPTNVHFVEASADQDLLGDLKMKATNDLSLRGNEAKLALKKGSEDLALVELRTKLDGQTEHKVIVPFSIKTTDTLPTVRGRAESNTNGQVLNLSLTDAGVDLVRSEFRRNSSTGATSYVLARDVALAKNEVLSMQYGSGEDNRQFVALRHAKTLKENITMVLDVRVNEGKKATLMYQVTARW